MTVFRRSCLMVSLISATALLGSCGGDSGSLSSTSGGGTGFGSPPLTKGSGSA